MQKGMNDKMKLFKERCKRYEDKDNLINELLTAIDKGDEALKILLFGEANPDEYSGKYKLGDHKNCTPVEGYHDEERTLCKCMYYFNSNHSKNCDTCLNNDKQYSVSGDYEIIDYEVPAFYKPTGVGNIDLIIREKSTNVLYATEVKPYDSTEFLLRMIGEIITYTYGDDTYKRAIAFFEKKRGTDGDVTHQQKEYDKADRGIMNLLKKLDITVFRFEEVGQKGYKICKL